MGLRLATLSLLLCAARPAAAQAPGATAVSTSPASFQFAPSPFDAAPSSAAAPAQAPAPPSAPPAPVAPNANFGQPLSVAGGPWVYGESLFTSHGKIISDYAWRDKLHGSKDHLYTAADLTADLAALKALNAFDRVSPTVYAMTNTPIPAQFAAIVISTSEVRVVFDVEVHVSSAPKPRLVTPPVAVSGVILTPTAFRGLGRYNTPGLGLDFNAAYYIGRLYGKNSYQNAPDHTDYLDRIGLWLLSADGKMQLQSDGPWRPALAVGAQGILMFHDAPPPASIANNTPGVAPGVQTTVSQQTTQTIADAYVVASKNIRNVRVSAGVMSGTIGELPQNLSEYLTPEYLQFYKGPAGLAQESVTHTVPFMSAFYLIKPDYPIGFEVMRFNGAVGSPTLINMKIGRFLKLNFDLGLLKYQGGYDLLGLIQFRFNQFPSR
jgi:hypothetical protein